MNRRVVVSVIAAAVIGLGLGVLVDIISPNAVDGAQLISELIILVIAVVIAVIPATRSWFPAAIAVLLGFFLGDAIGSSLYSRPPALQVASIVVRFDQPASATWPAGPADCIAEAGVLQYLDSGDSLLQMPGDRRLEFTLARGDYSPIGAAPQDFGVGMEVRIFETQPDGPAMLTIMGSTADSSIVVTGDAASGSATFSGLSIHPESEAGEPIEVAGTISWECPDA